MSVPAEVTQARLVIWDFDGVIKESTDVKRRAFVALFAWAGPDVMTSVGAHHDAHGGMSRYEKIPIYLRMAGETPQPARVAELCEAFSRQVLQAVIDAPWVPGVDEYLRANAHAQLFALVSATPDPELRAILAALALDDAFAEVHGAPTPKQDAVGQVLDHLGVSPAASVFIGDASADRSAAAAWDVPFVLRRHMSNRAVFTDYNGPSFSDFISA